MSHDSAETLSPDCNDVEMGSPAPKLGLHREEAVVSRGGGAVS